MGISERDYIRRRPTTPGRGNPIAALRGWSVNTWLIAICVAVFVIDGVIPPTEGLWQPVRTEISPEVPVDALFDRGIRYQEIKNQRVELAALERGTLRFTRDVIDISTSPNAHVGTVTYHWMPPFQRWFHFSTALGFLRVQVWRFVGFQFLHGSVTHLLFNMIALYFFGSIVERYLGGKRYLAFYLLCGMCGALMYLVLNFSSQMISLFVGHTVAVPGLLPGSMVTPLVGASAGVFGVLMAGAFLAPNAIVLLFFVLPMRLATLAYALVGLAIVSVIFGAQNAGGEAGHLGGAFAGFYLIRHTEKLHGFFDFVGWADPTSHHYRGPRLFKMGAATPRHEIDRILDKISADGLHSLTEREKRVLREASGKGG
ncbi:MAG: rhomboid family intramembrane serine protease [Phycisphaerales bacterium]